MGEWLTIFDRNGLAIGKKLRTDIHRDGDWHKTFHCWFLERKGQDLYIYLQQRAATKADFPNTYDVTAAGHLQHGEQMVAAGLREIKEELGVTLTVRDVLFAEVFKEALKFDHMIDNEMTHLYFHLIKKPVKFSLNDEVARIVRLKLDDLAALAKGTVTVINAFEIHPQRQAELIVTKDELCPHLPEYWNALVRAATKMCASYKY